MTVIFAALALALPAAEVAVVDGGAGADAVTSVSAIVPAVYGGATAIPAADMAALTAQYIKPCARRVGAAEVFDDACLVRAMAAIDVVALVFVERAAIAAIDRKELRLRRVPTSSTKALAQALFDAAHPELFGRVAVDGAPATATILIDDAVYDGGDVPIGPRRVRVMVEGFVPVAAEVRVEPKQVARVRVELVAAVGKTVPTRLVPERPTTPPPAVPASPGPAPSLGIVVGGVGAGVLALGAVAGVVGELMLQGAVADLRAQGEQDPAAIDGLVALSLGGGGVAAVGGVALIAGAVMFALE